MTATDAAPASMTSAARSSVIPPMATTGLPRVPACARRVPDAIEPDGVVAGLLRASSRRPARWRGR